MKINPKDFRVSEGKKVRLDKWPTKGRLYCTTKLQYQTRLQQHIEELSAQQKILYASNEYAVLIIFQGMDAAGKDAAIKHVMTGINPQGCEVFSFKHPSSEELIHDFLWRAICRLPERGRIGIFNRSYYEEVLIVQVHPELLQYENITAKKDRKALWKERYQSIVNLEKHLYRNKTHIIKFFLHLSKEEQRKRFLERLEIPDKNWKFSLDDIKEREFWDQYMKTYAACLSATSTEESPWYIVPADDKENAQLIISQIILEKFKELKLDYPKPNKERLAELATIRKRLEKYK